MSVPLIRLADVSKVLPAGPRLFSNVSMEIDRGETIALTGRSGSGKTTLLSILGLVDRPDHGSYEFAGRDTRRMRSRELDLLRGTAIGFVVQRFALFPYLNAVENVMTPLRHSSGMSERSMRAAAMSELEKVGMSELARRLPRRLSGGEQQRVAIARAMVHSPQLILADEPTGSLDQLTGEGVIGGLLDAVRDRNCALVVVTHDPVVASRMIRQVSLVEGHCIESEHADLPGEKL